MKKEPSKGTTLVEISIYFAIVAVVTLAFMTFAIQILNANRLSSNFQELESNLDFVSAKIISTIQTADHIDPTGSIFDNEQGQLTLVMPSGPVNTVSFSLSGGRVFMSENSAAQVQLNSDSVSFEAMGFHRATYPKSPDQIMLYLRVRPAATGIAALDKTLSLNTSVSLRNL